MTFLNPITALGLKPFESLTPQGVDSAQQAALEKARGGHLQVHGVPVSPDALSEACKLLSDPKTAQVMQRLAGQPQLDAYLHTGNEEMLWKMPPDKILSDAAIMSALSPMLVPLLTTSFSRAWQGCRPTILQRLISMVPYLNAEGQATCKAALQQMQSDMLQELEQLPARLQNTPAEEVTRRAIHLGSPVMWQILCTHGWVPNRELMRRLHGLALALWNEQQDAGNAFTLMELAFSISGDATFKAEVSEDYHLFRKNLRKGFKRGLLQDDASGLKQAAIDTENLAQKAPYGGVTVPMIRELLEQRIDVAGLNQMGPWADQQRHETAHSLLTLATKVANTLKPDIGPLGSEIIRMAMGMNVNMQMRDNMRRELDEVDFLSRSAPHFKLCAYCQKRPPDAPMEVLHFQELVRTTMSLGGVQNHYITRTFPVPKCTTCNNYKDKGCAYPALWLVIGAVAGGLLSLLIPGLAIWWQLLIGVPTGLVLSVVFGFISMAVANKRDKSPDKPLPITSFRPVKELLDKGWNIALPPR